MQDDRFVLGPLMVGLLVKLETLIELPQRNRRLEGIATCVPCEGDDLRGT
jgi:hypothetical protein